MRVLIIEDNTTTSYALELTLIENGARLAGTCRSSREALRLLDLGGVDFALIDLKLVDGFADDVIGELVRKRINFAVITGMLAFPATIPPEAAAVLEKPIDAQDLIATLAPFA